MKSQLEARQNNVITRVTNDMQSIESALSMVPMMLAAPFINFAAYLVIGIAIGWDYVGLTLLVWLVIIVL